MTAAHSKTTLALVAGLVLLAAGSPLLAAAGWNTNYAKALADAKKDGKIVLADFTGSDWCGWCVKLSNEVFNTQAFKDWAAKNVVLLVVDYPRARPQTPALRKQNAQLKDKYGISGYPTVLFLDHNGGVLGRSGYIPGGPEKWTTNAQSIIDSAPKPEKLEPVTSFAQALTAAGEAHRPILAIASSGKAAATATRIKNLFENADFVSFAKSQMIVAQVDTDTQGDDLNAFEDWCAKLKVGKSPIRTVLADPTGGKPLYTSSLLVNAEALIPRLAAVLPKPEYDAGTWLVDFDRAKLVSAALRRPILMHFTGSDWCGWCVKLEEEVYSTAGFQSLVKQKYVLMKVDLPKKKQLPAAEAAQNKRLASVYGVRSLPTIVVLSPGGAGEKGRVNGYPNEGARGFLTWLGTMLR